MAEPTAWPPTALAALDIESTSVDVEDARTVEICLALIHPGQPVDVRRALINPGVEIPQGAIDVHGITNERIQAEGKPPPEVLDLWVGDIALALRAGLPLVVMNANYDLTVLDRDCRRHGLPTLEERLGHPVGPVLDPMVLDKQCIKYRKRVSETQGARQLKTLCQVYGVQWDDEQAHAAEYDTLQAARVVWRIGRWSMLPADELLAKQLGPHTPPRPMHRNDVGKFRRLATMSLAQLHEAQAGWYAEQTESFEGWLHEQANEWRHQADTAPDDEARAIAEQELAGVLERLNGLRYEWPLVPFEAPAVPA
jgi:DNA polymerase-3 subunit epsilon